MILIDAIVNLALGVATVALITCVAFLMYSFLYILGVPLHGDPVVSVLAVGCGVALHLYRGSTPIEEIRRFFDLGGRGADVGLRLSKRCRGP